MRIDPQNEFSFLGMVLQQTDCCLDSAEVRAHHHDLVKLQLVHQWLLVPDLLEANWRNKRVQILGIPANFVPLLLFELFAITNLLLQNGKGRVELGLRMPHD